MIKLIKDINIFGSYFEKNTEIYPPTDLSEQGSCVVVFTFIQDNGMQLTTPINCKVAGISVIDLLNEIVELNTNHESYQDYLDDKAMVDNCMGKK